MSLRVCHCRAHVVAAAPASAQACAGATGAAASAAGPDYVAPTRALLLQLTHFGTADEAALRQTLSPSSDPSSLALQSLYPHLACLLQRSASMQLAWEASPRKTTAVAAAVAPSAIHDEDAGEEARSAAVALRVLGLSRRERAAAARRAELLRDARVRSGVAASPAASYPPLFGSSHARMELASNNLPLVLQAQARRDTLRKEEGGESTVRHCNEPVYLSTQTPTASEANSLDQRLQPFFPPPSPLHYSSVPLFANDASQRFCYIQRIVRHVADRLALRVADTPSSSTSSSSAAPPAHILLLHLDAHSLFGAPNSASLAPEEHTRTSLAFADQLLAALMTQLQPNASVRTVDAQTTGAYPPSPLPPLAATALTSSAAAFSNAAAIAAAAAAAPTSPLQAASMLFSAPPASVLCPELMWGLILDGAEDHSDDSSLHPPPELEPEPSGHGSLAQEQQRKHLMKASVLHSLRPVQSFRVQDGCVSAPETRWSNCSAFLYHAETTRMHSTADTPSSSAASSSSLPSPATPLVPLQGRLHILHWVRELLFKLGLGSKYGA